MMRCLTLLLALSALLAPPARADDRYLSALPDIPVMDGAVEEPAEAALFEGPQGGGIASALITAPKTAPAALLAFYGRVLPPLGWVGAGPGLYRRGDVQLRLTARALPGGGGTLSFERVENAEKP